MGEGGTPRCGSRDNRWSLGLRAERAAEGGRRLPRCDTSGYSMGGATNNASLPSRNPSSLANPERKAGFATFESPRFNRPFMPRFGASTTAICRLSRTFAAISSSSATLATVVRPNSSGSFGTPSHMPECPTARLLICLMTSEIAPRTITRWRRYSPILAPRTNRWITARAAASAAPVLGDRVGGPASGVPAGRSGVGSDACRTHRHAARARQARRLTSASAQASHGQRRMRQDVSSRASHRGHATPWTATGK